MHILVTPSWYKTPQAPNAGTFFEDQVRMLQAHGHQVAVYCPIWTGSFRAAVVRGFRNEDHRYDDAGVPTYHQTTVPRVPGDNRFNLGYLRRRARRFGVLYEKEWGRPDVVHAHSTLWGGYAASSLAAHWSVPLVLTEHTTGLIRDRAALSTVVVDAVRSVASAARAIICVSRSFRDELAVAYGGGFATAHVIGNVIPDAFYATPLTVPPFHPFKWVSIAALIQRKRPLLLLEAFRLFASEVPGAKLQIVGDGAMRREIERRIQDLGLSNHVWLRGSLSRIEVMAALHESHALVSTSAYETFGVGIAEALAMGRPVALTECGGARDVVSDGAGVFATDDTAPGVCAAMLRVQRQYDGFDPARLRRSIGERYSPAAVYARLLYVYQRLVGSGTER